MQICAKLCVLLAGVFVLCCGFDESNSLTELVPLVSVNVTGLFFDILGKVIVTQRWQNPLNASVIEGKHKFSLSSNAVVCGLKMKIGNNSWTGKVEEKSAARVSYDAAVNEGKQSSLLEQLSANDYQLNVGPIAPGEDVEIVIQYLVRTVVRPDGSYHFVLPTNIAQKYISSSSNNPTDNEYGQRFSNVPYSSRPVGYEYNVDITWTAGSALREVVSTTNTIETHRLNSRSVRIRCTTAPENGDFSLQVTTDQALGAYSFTVDDGETYLYVHNQIPAETVEMRREKDGVHRRKITVMLDRSGSMAGSKLSEAIEAVRKFVGLLPTNENDGTSKTYINVVSFDHDYQAFYSHAVPVTTESIASIQQRVDGIKTDNGGTELLNSLEAVVKNRLDKWEINTNVSSAEEFNEHVIVLLTDGQVYNLNSIVEMLQQQEQQQKTVTRVMTIGIGRDADRKLVEQIAEASHGLWKMLVDENEVVAALQEVVTYIDKQYYIDVHMEGDYNASSVQDVSVLYPSHPISMFVKVNASQLADIKRNGLTVAGTDPIHHSTKRWHIAVDRIIPNVALLETLYAHGRINQLSKQLSGIHVDDFNPDVKADGIKPEIINVSIAHGIINPFTSFIIVSDHEVPTASDSYVRIHSIEVSQWQHFSAHAPHPPWVTGSSSLMGMGMGMAAGGGDMSLFVKAAAAGNAEEEDSNIGEVLMFEVDDMHVDTQLFGIPLTPLLNQTIDGNNGTCTAQLGYDNTGPAPLYQPVTFGLVTEYDAFRNEFSPIPHDRGQPTTFKVGRFDLDFAVKYPCEAGLTWHLGTSTLVVSPAFKEEQEL